MKLASSNVDSMQTSMAINKTNNSRLLTMCTLFFFSTAGGLVVRVLGVYLIFVIFYTTTILGQEIFYFSVREFATKVYVKFCTV